MYNVTKYEWGDFVEIEFNKEISYKDLCEMLNEKEVTGGTNRDRQLCRMNKEYEVEKVRRGKYIIKRQRSETEIKLNSDKQNYSRYLQAILLNMIAENPSVEMIFTYRQIREKLMMVNSKYFPVKYHKEKIDYDIPTSYINSDGEKAIYCLEQDWIEISDQHDKAAIRYALKALKEKNLLTSLNETYLFYKFEKDAAGNIIFHLPVEATKEQLSKIHQRQLDYMKENIPNYTMEKVKEKVTAKELVMGNLSNGDFVSVGYEGYLIQAMYSNNRELVYRYYNIVDDYVKELGYDRYAKAFKIVRPANLESVVGYFAPTFNKKQVERYLTNKRFNSMPIFFHHQIVEKLIKK